MINIYLLPDLHKTARNEVVKGLLTGYFYGANSQNNMNDGAFGQKLILINMRMYMRCCRNMIPFQQPPQDRPLHAADLAQSTKPVALFINKNRENPLCQRFCKNAVVLSHLLQPQGLSGAPYYTLTTSSKCSLAQLMSCSMAGMSDLPVSLNLYSTRGGTSG